MFRLVCELPPCCFDWADGKLLCVGLRILSSVDQNALWNIDFSAPEPETEDVELVFVIAVEAVFVADADRTPSDMAKALILQEQITNKA